MNNMIKKHRIVFFTALLLVMPATFTTVPAALKSCDLDNPYEMKAGSPAAIRKEPLPRQRCEHRAFQGIPSIASAPGGRLWAAWYGGREVESADDDVYVATSGDGGRTWTDPVLVVDAQYPVRCFDEVLWRDPAGRVWLFWSQAVMYQYNAWTWAMVAGNPDHPEGDWSRPFKVAPGIMMNKPTVLSTGEWLLTIEPEGRSVAQIWASPDQGKSFQFKGGADVPDWVRAPLEHMVVERQDGSLWMLVRTTYGIGESVSFDRGVTWTEVSPSSVAHPSARFHLRKLNSGNLLLVKHGPITEQTDRERLTAYLSEDEGRTWLGGLMLDERTGVSYPDGCIAEDGTIRIVYDFQRTRDKEILMAVFREEDVRAGRAVSDRAKFGILVNKAHGLPVWDPVTMDALREQFDVDVTAKGIVPPDGIAPAVMRWIEGEETQTRRGMRVSFPYRDHRIVEWPGRLSGTVLIRSPEGRAAGICLVPGLLYVVTPSGERHPESDHDKLLARGFSQTPEPGFILFYGREYVSRIYWKKLETGEAIDLGPWSLVLLPE